MLSMEPKTVRWGILATGAIAESFTRDLLVDPNTREVTDIRHTVAAAASSSSKTRAEAFLKKIKAPSTARGYGTYKELVEDPDVDIIYIATPHSHHFQNCMLALEAGKNVLCEKPFTVNSKQAQILIQKAREKDLFLMEAVWVRYFPISAYVRELCTSGKIGTVQRVVADYGSAFCDPDDASKNDDMNRTVNIDLAGGVLLDQGIYALTWIFQCLYSTQPLIARQKPNVLSFLKAYHTGADEMTTVLLEFPRSKELGGTAHAVATSSTLFSPAPGDNNDAPTIRVTGTKGEVQIYHPAPRPTRTRLILRDGTVEDKNWPQPGPGAGSGWFNGFESEGFHAEGEGHGMFWEADEAARAIVEGRKESRVEDMNETLVIMQVMDEVRQKAGMVYPEEIETTQYPVALKGK